jgi:hypothetical protein
MSTTRRALPTILVQALMLATILSTQFSLSSNVLDQPSVPIVLNG